MSRRPRLLIVDDNEIDREAIRRLLGPDYDVDEAATAEEGLRRVREHPPDCLLLDYRLPDASGVEALASFGETGVPVVMLSGFGSESVAVAALKGGAQDYLSKDELSADALRVAVNGAIDRVTLQQELARRSQELDILLGQLPAGVWTVGHDLVVRTASGRQLDLLGLGGIVGVRLTDPSSGLLGSDELIRCHRAALAGTPASAAVSAGGRSYDVRLEPLRDARGERVGAVGLLQDTSERKRLEEQLQQAQKMDALGRLAGGVAHDFNNLLTIMLSCADLARAELPADHPARADLDEVVGAAERAAELTGQLLAFSRRRMHQPSVVDVVEQVTATGRMLARLMGDAVVLETHVAPDSGRVRMDPGALQQVILNLAVNARDATPPGGRVVVDVGPIDLVAGWHDFRGVEPAPGPYVRIVVNDTGVGMTSEVRDRLFEPFFSTKPPGRGTGLGLATVFGIVTQGGGALQVYSEVGRGTAFHVYLPRVDDQPTAAPAPERTDGRGTETALLVEDDPQIRQIAARVLAEHGYDVRVAASADEAVLVLEDGQPVDVLITDLVMPGRSGDDLVAEARALRPGLKAVVMSGYSPQLVRASSPDVRVLQKPFTPVQLVRALRGAIDAPAG